MSEALDIRDAIERRVFGSARQDRYRRIRSAFATTPSGRSSSACAKKIRCITAARACTARIGRSPSSTTSCRSRPTTSSSPPSRHRDRRSGGRFSAADVHRHGSAEARRAAQDRERPSSRRRISRSSKADHPRTRRPDPRSRAAQRDVQLGRQDFDRTDDADAGDAVRFSVGRSPQADALVRLSPRRRQSGVVGAEDERRAELLECLDYFTELWNDRAKTTRGSDLISMLAHGEATQNMPPKEFLGNLMLLIVGGNDTTRNSITGGVSRSTDSRTSTTSCAQIRRSSRTWCRRSSAGRRRSRTCAAPRCRTSSSAARRSRGRQGGDVVRLGQPRRGSDRIPTNSSSTAPNARHHLSFGFGIHRCVGNRLAEMQLRIVWEEILKRFSASSWSASRCACARIS